MEASESAFGFFWNGCNLGYSESGQCNYMFSDAFYRYYPLGPFCTQTVPGPFYKIESFARTIILQK